MTAAPTSDAPDVPVRGHVLDETAPELTRTYAEALINAVGQDGQVDEVLAELDAIVAEVLEPFPPFAAMLDSPAIRAQEKDRLLVRTFEGRTLPIVLQFLRVLNRHGRLDLVAPIARRARAIWDKRQNRVPVTVTTAVALNDTEQATLRERLARLTGATPIIHLEVDPSLIGGLVIQVGDDVYDASVRNQLAQLRRSLIEGKTHEIQSRRDHFSLDG
ncbi:MAG TPA: ATP synthase F1 subunit delta [Isosphaeraceae bacterium]|jgi:F-type H+-transporting ATPase subunit delta|nr:ATP synthase F1 subunit delta [Isosphaeraceae bacterium]